MLFRNKMQNGLNLILGSKNFIFVLSFLIVAFFKNKCCPDWFGGLVLYQSCSYQLKHTCFILILLSFLVFLPSVETRLQCLLLLCLQDFNVFHFYAYKTSMSYVFMPCKTSMSFVYAFKTSMSSAL